MAQASAEILERARPAGRKVWPPLPNAKGTDPSVLIIKTRGGRDLPWRESGGSDREHGGVRVFSTVKEGRFKGEGRASKDSLPRRSRSKHEQVRGRKDSP